MQSATHEVTDEQILVLCHQPAQIEKGFRLLMVKYQEKLYWHVRRLVIEHEDANDVIQNVFVKAYRGIEGFKGKSKLYTWLYRIATNEAITFLNRKKRRRTSSIDEEEHDLANRLKADDYFDGNEAQIKLQQALTTLPDKQKIVFNMRYFEEMSYKEMSAVLETSVGALKASYHHAVKKIERHLLEER
ncbi:MAG: sigma-70 family RNA polymerase sigma factor [Bacteroidota bacterium]